jgi:hypothetical protein
MHPMLFDRFSAELRQLSAALDDPDIDLATELEDLATMARDAVASFRGLSVTITLHGHPVTVTALDPGSDVDIGGTSLALPLSSVTTAAPGSVLILFASNPGAFTDLAADISWSTQTPLDQFQIDQHLHLRATGSGISGLAELSTLNQAIGVLIERGQTPGQARDHLQQRAEADGHDVHDIARAILASLDNPPRIGGSTGSPGSPGG